eukprot:gnl/Spiro4/21643_TR10602_c0_g1_i1.p1 gnl/Spiro4/21643_TR10602_c0_g1~~gnl/Spiro4/21643_TR10602_c0_g1_i1.p1  ORF type:complete len:972 (+),score=185.22 gnl/Spiro4/21643_TR10602_c0_g1_i1:94-2916(+)
MSGDDLLPRENSLNLVRELTFPAPTTPLLPHRESSLLLQLVSMGFSEDNARRALELTNNEGVEAAVDTLLAGALVAELDAQEEFRRPLPPPVRPTSARTRTTPAPRSRAPTSTTAAVTAAPRASSPLAAPAPLPLPLPLPRASTSATTATAASVATTAATASMASTAVVDCQICFASVSVRECPAAPCGHLFHVECWEGHLRARIEDGRVLHMVCPLCTRVLTPDEVRGIVDAELFERYDRLRTTAELLKDPTVRMCPRPDCPGHAKGFSRTMAPLTRVLLTLLQCSIVAFALAYLFSVSMAHHYGVKVDDLFGFVLRLPSLAAILDDSFSWTVCALSLFVGLMYGLWLFTQPSTVALDLKRSVCGSCSYVLCFDCNSKFHPFLTCTEVHDSMLAVWARDKDASSCPKCGVGIERTMGCNHMTCRCGHQFCFMCGAANYSSCGCSGTRQRPLGQSESSLDLKMHLQRLRIVFYVTLGCVAVHSAMSGLKYLVESGFKAKDEISAPGVWDNTLAAVCSAVPPWLRDIPLGPANAVCVVVAALVHIVQLGSERPFSWEVFFDFFSLLPPVQALGQLSVMDGPMVIWLPVQLLMPYALLLLLAPLASVCKFLEHFMLSIFSPFGFWMNCLLIVSMVATFFLIILLSRSRSPRFLALCLCVIVPGPVLLTVIYSLLHADFYSGVTRLCGSALMLVPGLLFLFGNVYILIFAIVWCWGFLHCRNGHISPSDLRVIYRQNYTSILATTVRYAAVLAFAFSVLDAYATRFATSLFLLCLTVYTGTFTAIMAYELRFSGTVPHGSSFVRDWTTIALTLPAPYLLVSTLYFWCPCSAAAVPALEVAGAAPSAVGAVVEATAAWWLWWWWPAAELAGEMCSVTWSLSSVFISSLLSFLPDFVWTLASWVFAGLSWLVSDGIPLLIWAPLLASSVPLCLLKVYAWHRGLDE